MKWDAGCGIIDAGGVCLANPRRLVPPCASRSRVLDGLAKIPLQASIFASWYNVRGRSLLRQIRGGSCRPALRTAAPLRSPWYNIRGRSLLRQIRDGLRRPALRAAAPLTSPLYNVRGHHLPSANPRRLAPPCASRSRVIDVLAKMPLQASIFAS